MVFQLPGGLIAEKYRDFFPGETKTYLAARFMMAKAGTRLHDDFLKEKDPLDDAKDTINEARRVLDAIKKQDTVKNDFILEEENFGDTSIDFEMRGS